MIEVTNILGVRSGKADCPTFLYLAQNGDLTPDPIKARQVPDSKLHLAVQDICKFSRKYFIKQVVAE